MSARKLQAWIQRIKLTSGPDRSVADEKADEEEDKKSENEENKGEEAVPDKPALELEGEDVIDPIAAIVCLKIPKLPREPEIDEEGQEIHVEVPESELEDIPFEDKCL